MTRERMTQMLSETICVSAEEARAALEAREWKVLDAAQLLRQQRARARKAEVERLRRDREWQLGRAVRGLVARLHRAPEEARADEEALPELTADALAPLMLMPAVYACR